MSEQGKEQSKKWISGELREESFPPPSNNEIHYLWYYMQGSIMAPDVRDRLRDAWGFCERHAWIALLVECSLRHSFLMGPAVLYGDILNRAVSAFDITGPMKHLRLIAGLRDRGPCLMCTMGLKPHQRGYAGADTIARGRDRTELTRFSEMTRGYWEKTICGRCLGSDSPNRCRRHLMEDLRQGSAVNIVRHKTLVNTIRRHLAAYCRSCGHEQRGTATPEDTAAIISTVGWCSGWQPLLELMNAT